MVLWNDVPFMYNGDETRNHHFELHEKDISICLLGRITLMLPLQQGKSLPMFHWDVEGVALTLNLLMPRYLAQPFNVIKWQLKFNLAA
jgi:hypothetical protein